ncbi:MAG: DUF421 domain-containing protein [Firmicutes bacterium]|nr:DUF421 domain-containing protein [Bacillota bacterium]MBQ6842712.1 DUF421 domain-containing protein [Bacillota bacterium]
MAVLLIRTVLVYFVTLIMMNTMGKRQLGQLQPFELVLLLIISEMAAVAMEDNTKPLLSSFVPIAALGTLQLLISYLCMRSLLFRRLFCGRPDELIHRGVVQEQTMRELRLNLSDLQELLRGEGYFDLNSVEEVVIETNGSISVWPKTAERPLQLSDIRRRTKAEQLPEVLITDGRINASGLRRSGKDMAWLNRQLRRHDLYEDELFIAGIDQSGQFYYQKKDKAGGAL